jgi:hypothetical protein
VFELKKRKKKKWRRGRGDLGGYNLNITNRFINRYISSIILSIIITCHIFWQK